MKIVTSKVITRSVVGLGILASFFVSSTVFATNNHSNGNNNPGNNITICHATSSHNNPYIVNTPNANGNVSGHNDHDGPIWPLTNSKGDWGDIIPTFSYNSGNSILQYPGKNWTAQGHAIWNNGCNIPQATPTPSPTPSITPPPAGGPSPVVTPTPTPTPVVTPTPTPVVSSTPAPSATPVASNNPSGSTTTAPVAPAGQILGAKTLAPTGNTDSLMTLMTTLGIVLMALSAKRYAQETR